MDSVMYVKLVFKFRFSLSDNRKHVHSQPPKNCASRRSVNKPKIILFLLFTWKNVFTIFYFLMWSTWTAIFHLQKAKFHLIVKFRRSKANIFKMSYIFVLQLYHKGKSDLAMRYKHWTVCLGGESLQKYVS